MPRCIITATITFGLVSIPVKLYTAAAPVKIDFNLITKDGNKVKQQLVDEITNLPIERENCARGFEYAKGQYLKFGQDELKSLESKSDGVIVVKEFVDNETVDPVAVEKTYYLGPDKAGDRGYLLLSRTLKKLGKVAVATWAARGRDKLIVISPYRNGLLLNEMFYENEVRPFNEIEATVPDIEISDLEIDLAEKLVGTLSKKSYDPSPYFDGYRKRVQEAVERKLQGLNIEETPTPPVQPSILNMLEALKRSLTAAEAAVPPPSPVAAPPAPESKRTRRKPATEKNA